MARTILIIELLMGATLLFGMLLARAKRFRAHGICQSVVVMLNLGPIIAFMVPQFRTAVVPGLPAHLSDRFHAVTTAHAVLGGTAEILGLYIVLAAGTNLLPRVLRLGNYKRWMRAELLIWWLVIAFGVGNYWIWNVATATPPVTGAVKTPAPTTARTVNVTIGNFAFDPKDLQIEAGTTVIWKNTAGHHTVTADDGSFESPILEAGEEFKRTFDQPGSFKYFCNLHGAAGGQKMAGTVTVANSPQR
jgi:plastocyanin